MSYWISRGNTDRNDAYVNKGVGGQCGKGWVGVRGNCRRSTTKKGGKGGLMDSQKAKAREMAEKIREERQKQREAGSSTKRMAKPKQNRLKPRTIKPRPLDMSIAKIDARSAKSKQEVIALLGREKGEIEWARIQLEANNSDLHIEELGDTKPSYPRKAKTSRRKR